MRDIKDVAKYIGLNLIQKGFEVSPLKLQKMLYYVQAWYMVFFGRENTLFEDAPQAWVNGPVYPTIFNEYRGISRESPLRKEAFGVASDSNVEDEIKKLVTKMNLNEEEIACLDSIISLYGMKNQDVLVAYTHTERPWMEKREGLQPYQSSTEELSLDTMYSYYKTRRENHINRKN